MEKKRIVSTLALLAASLLIVSMFCSQPSSSAPAQTFSDDSCKGIASTYMECKSCCTRKHKFKGAYMNWDGCWCHNELHRGDPVADEDW